MVEYSHMTHLQTILRDSIQTALRELDLFDGETIQLEHPSEMSHGDWSCNVAMKLARTVGMAPIDLSERIVSHIYTAGLPDDVAEISVAQPGFINIKLSHTYFSRHILYPQTETEPLLKGKKIMVEYTDPNPFKEFHIGHLMNNAIGESLARIAESNGAVIVRACYQGDVGPHIAKCIWGMIDLAPEMPTETDPLDQKTAFIGRAYAHGAAAYADSEQAKMAIDLINTAIYAGNDAEINRLYETGRQWCLDQFDVIYKKLGTQFDAFYFESQMAQPGLALVREHIPDIFVESDGAIVYPGEQDGLHTRVFITKNGNPTYETKDLANNRMKFRDYPDLDQSIIITANEQNEYFRVMFAALNHLNPEIVAKTTQYGHGMMLGSDGKKLSSRKGNVLTGETLIAEVTEMIQEKSASSEHKRELNDKTVTDIAVGAIKYSILKQTIGKNIVFDFDTSLSFDGDSGPYLQYTYARLSSLIQKSKSAGILPSQDVPADWVSTDLERWINRSEEIIHRAWLDKSPQQIVTYCIKLTQAFNSWYSSTKIIDESDPMSSYKIAIVHRMREVLGKQLNALGIVPVEEM